MNEKTILVMAFLLAAGIIVLEGQPFVGVIVPVDEMVSSKIEIPLKSAVSGAFISGEWDGKGRALVWLEGEKGNSLVLDTINLRSKRFKSYCDESCESGNIGAKKVVVVSEGAGLYVHDIHVVVPQVASAWAQCPGCQRVEASGLPNHRILAIVVLVLLLVVSGHVMRSVCKNNVCRRGSLGVFIGGAGLLLALFGLSVVSFDGAVNLFVQYATSVLAAAGVMALFAFGAVEMISRGHEWRENQK